MMTWKIAFRNLLRNRRRSAVTLLAIAVGAIGIVLFGEFVRFVTAGLETGAVAQVGHLTVYRKGYLAFGTGSPGEYGIDHYADVVQLIQGDAELAPTLAVVTPIVSLAGIAGNFDIDASKTFLGTGVVPSERERLLRWDPYGVNTRRQFPDPGLRDDDDTVGVVGVGLARVLGLCEPLHIADCPSRPTKVSSGGAAIAPELASLAAADRSLYAAPRPRLDLLAATAGGAPNVVSLLVSRAEPQGVRELDENYVAMHIALAQKLLYGRAEPKATGIVVQLRRTGDMPRVRARLASLFAARGLELEIHDFAELQPFYTQAVGMFRAIFLFIALIMGVIVLFSVVNTMGTSVVERTTEIGTARAIGLRRGAIRRLFVAEGAILGAIGAAIGVALAQLVATLINHGGLTWTPPGNASPVPLLVLTTGAGGLIAVVWLVLVAVATLAALVAANRGARLEVVDALRHV
jgi:putative ABC transport system permease protein